MIKYANISIDTSMNSCGQEQLHQRMKILQWGQHYNQLVSGCGFPNSAACVFCMELYGYIFKYRS